jgi:hypothetical protein
MQWVNQGDVGLAFCTSKADPKKKAARLAPWRLFVEPEKETN